MPSSTETGEEEVSEIPREKTMFGDCFENVKIKSDQT
jgi:hypothetical protein